MRIALTGTGHWHAPIHLDAIRAAGAEVCITWDPDAAVAGRFAAAHGLACAATWEDVLEAGPDMVVVMGHPLAVPRTARACLAAGLPMILEKPAAPDSDTLAALAPGGAFVAVPLANRCSPLWTERGGTALHAHFRIINGPPERYLADGVPWMLEPAVAGGGALRNLGLHAADAALSVLGGLPWRLVAAELRGGAIDTYALAVLAAAGGPVVTIETGYSFASMAPGGDFEWRVAEAGMTLIDRGDRCAITTLADGATRTIDCAPRYRAFFADTFARFRAGRPPVAGFDDYLAAMRLVDRIYGEAGR